jgi:hypothetical protein
LVPELGTVPVSGVLRERTVQVWTGTFMRYTRDTIGTLFPEKLSLRHPKTDKFSGTGSPVRQILGPHIPEQSVRHHYFIDGRGL